MVESKVPTAEDKEAWVGELGVESKERAAWKEQGTATGCGAALARRSARCRCGRRLQFMESRAVWEEAGRQGQLGW